MCIITESFCLFICFLLLFFLLLRPQLIKKMPLAELGLMHPSDSHVGNTLEGGEDKAGRQTETVTAKQKIWGSFYIQGSGSGGIVKCSDDRNVLKTESIAFLDGVNVRCERKR